MRKLFAFCIISLILLFFPMSDAFAIEYEILPVNPVMIAPFILLLLSIAIMPFINRHWWEHNYPLVSFALGAVTVIYYFFILKNAP
ncbi:MAG: sodium:proton antiporter, partial [Candidatus Kryptonium sp.]